ncbi:macrophage mannose receptor 1-like [Helicoverpa zea]|uniref:macrophage mannose receptor 1-like n=1 Tax=Helicoverpa zea TaxID=7113 RepID=UPI001F56DF69|nr:macrophage mannose receptor 1-like [Helicoverpa zea]
MCICLTYHHTKINSVPVSECAFRCDYQYRQLTKGWFKLHEVPETWQDARLRCTLQGAVLASPTSSAMAAEMRNTMKNFFLQDTEIFTGIHSTFSSGSYQTVDGIPLSKIPLVWANNEPDNFGNKERCITFNSNGSAVDRMCEEPRPYICFRSGEKEVPTNRCGTVDDEYNYDEKTKTCYKFHRVPGTFDRAHFVCLAEGGHLAIINSKEEAEVLRKLFAKYPASSMAGTFHKDVAIIGFHDWGSWGDWRTIHGETLKEAGYDKFSGGQPNNATTGEHCGSIFRSALLNDFWCDQPAAFICEKDPAYPPVCQPKTDEEIEIDKRFHNEVQ